MTPAARFAAAIDVLAEVLEGAPAERALTRWARASRFAGSKDRAAVRDITFDCLRARNSLMARGFGGARGVVAGYALREGIDLEEVFSGRGYAAAPLSAAETASLGQGGSAIDLPDWIIPQMQADLGARFYSVARALTQRASVDLRVNLARATRAEMVQSLAEEGIETVPLDAPHSALRVTEGARKINNSRAYRDGLVELQDAASQDVVAHLPLPTCGKLLDYCAGGGGKTLAICAAEPGLNVSAWDAAPQRLAPLKERVNRARARVNLLKSQPIAPGAWDFVLADVPCSGSGAWRRNPDARWALTPERLQELLRLQREILDAASRLVRQNGQLAYVTCSLLESENNSQIRTFCQKNPDWRLQSQHSFGLNDPAAVPQADVCDDPPQAPADGLYLAVLNRSK